MKDRQINTIQIRSHKEKYRQPTGLMDRQTQTDIETDRQRDTDRQRAKKTDSIDRHRKASH